MSAYCTRLTFSLQVKSNSEDVTSLPITSAPLKGKKDLEGYQIILMTPVEPGNGVKVEIEMALINAVVPFPKEISQVQSCSCVSRCVVLCRYCREMIVGSL